MKPKEKEKRFRSIQEYGCVVCLWFDNKHTIPDVHHITRNGSRISHAFTYGLCHERHHMNGGEGVAVHPFTKAFEETYMPQFQFLITLNDHLGISNDYVHEYLRGQKIGVNGTFKG